MPGCQSAKRVDAARAPRLRHPVAPDAGLPVRAEEVISLDVLRVVRLPLLVEAFRPGLLRVGLHRLAREDGGVLEHAPAVLQAEGVVVAEHEQALDLASVRRAVVREHLEPGVGDGLELARQPKVGHVARDHHGVDALVAKVCERLFERVRFIAGGERTPVGGKPHVHVAHHAELQQGRDAIYCVRRTRNGRAGARPSQRFTCSPHPRRKRGTDETSACHVHVKYLHCPRRRRRTRSHRPR